MRGRSEKCKVKCGKSKDRPSVHPGGASSDRRTSGLRRLVFSLFTFLFTLFTGFGCGHGLTGRADNDPLESPTDEKRLEGAALRASLRMDLERHKSLTEPGAETPSDRMPLPMGSKAPVGFRCPADRRELEPVVLYEPPAAYAKDDVREDALYCREEKKYWYRVSGGLSGKVRMYGPFTLPSAR